ncbi:hypothetical protein [Phenylobacterium sp.]|uniref:hypothetical protein n=1 Tax=Phenylobacterium sp. TaxID=1871053 RepID=UPI00271B0AA6|nr:hypothetical protein [Phenylobacterium sp.]MDO8379216.1 hypothetical protein [Phenylobacterium sp.]
MVRFRETWPSGAIYSRVETLYRPNRGGLWDLEDLATYLEAANGGAISAERKDELECSALDGLGEGEPNFNSKAVTLSAPGGPVLDALAFLQALDAVEIWRDADSYVVPDWDPGPRLAITAAALRSMLDAAYLAGRRVREAELPSDMARNRAAKTAQKRSEDAEAWWVEGATWAQSLVDSWPAGQRLSLNSLGADMWLKWTARPFAPSGPARVEAADLSRRVLPKWKAAGSLRLPKQ